MCYDALLAAQYGEPETVHRVLRWDDPDPPAPAADDQPAAATDAAAADQPAAAAAAADAGQGAAGGLREQMDAMAAALCMNLDALTDEEDRVLCTRYSETYGLYRDV
jgi:hypothetical protein